MKQVKMFVDYNANELEKKINEFISKTSIVYDIKYQVSDKRHSAMVIYEA